MVYRNFKRPLFANGAFGIPEDIAMQFVIDVAEELGFDGPNEEEISAQLKPLLETWTCSIAAIA
jgi:hypothetical protein